MTILATALAAPLLLIALVACSGDDGSTTAADPAAAPGAPAEAPRPPTSVPAASGEVRSTALPTVMDTGDGAELCLGAIAESYPPQCGGPAITNWDWAAYEYYDEQGDVRWGTFAVTGTWDGTAFTVTDALTGALYDPMMAEPVVLPEPSVTYGDAELQGISDALADELPGYQGSYVDDAGHVLTDVLYDDGTLQAYVDEAYGAGVVVVNGALVDVE